MSHGCKAYHDGIQTAVTENPELMKFTAENIAEKRKNTSEMVKIQLS